MLTRVSWSAVVATLLMGAALAALFFDGWSDAALVLALCAIAWAILSTKETS
jgi:uncharacterized membrane protein YjjP (DUF1212 family)